jgi:2-polyprenyl-3-methyl-5-hydroxy-6-metoxy-1,4-benzoquinol methylase
MRVRAGPSGISINEATMRSQSPSPSPNRPRGSPAARETWESQYASGAWDYLAGDDEAGHYLAIAGFCKAHFPQGRLLDIGCGTGILLDYLQRDAALEPGRYTGIDLAQEALRQAAQRFPEAHFAQCDYAATGFPGRYDALVFNETLYCFADPLAILEKCLAENAAPGALLIISMYGEHHEDIWTAVTARCDVVDEQLVENRERGVLWKVRALRRKDV